MNWKIICGALAGAYIASKLFSKNEDNDPQTAPTPHPRKQPGHSPEKLFTVTVHACARPIGPVRKTVTMDHKQITLLKGAHCKEAIKGWMLSNYPGVDPDTITSFRLDVKPLVE